MVKLQMKAFFFANACSDDRYSTWWLGTKNKKSARFPSRERIAELWREHLPEHGELVVITGDAENYRGVRILKGTLPKQREPFIDALSQEVQYQ